MRKIIDLQDPALLMQGLFPSVPANQLGLWRTGKNVEFRDNGVCKGLGRTQLDTRASTIYALSQTYAEGLRRAYVAEASRISKYEYGTVTQIGSGFGGLGYWSLEPWGNWLIATNSYDPPKVYKNTGTMTNLAGVRRGTFRLVKKHRNHVLGYWGQSVDWSDESNPEVWAPDEDNKAGDMFIRDLDSDIVAAQPLGAHFGIYSWDSLVIQQYVGAPFYFGFPSAIGGIGALSDSAIVPVGNRHFGLGIKGVFTTDGIGFQYVDTPAIKQWVKDNIDLNERRRVVGFHDEANETVKWFFICKDAAIRGIGFCYTRNTWTMFEDGVTAAADHSVFDAPLVAAGTSWGLSSGSNLGASAMSCELQTFPLDATERERFKLWDMMRVDFEGSGLEFRLGFSDEYDAAPEWNAWATLERDNWIHRESVYLHIAFRSTGAGTNWKITGISVHGEGGGWI